MGGKTKRSVKTNRKEKPNFKTTRRKYLDDKLEPQTWQKWGVFMATVVFAGTFGWLYEMIFYYFDGGTGKFYMQGGNFLPWINIYAIGAVLIVATTWKLKKYPRRSAEYFSRLRAKPYKVWARRP